VDYFDVKKFGADFAFTLDGGELGELSYETFNAAQAKVTIHGKSIHPGEAKNKMKNAILMAMDYINQMPLLKLQLIQRVTRVFTMFIT